MRRSIYIPIGLILAALSVVAIVRAQDWNAWRGNAAAPGNSGFAAQASPGGTGSSFGQSEYFPNQPNQISHPAATPVPSRFAASQHAQQQISEQPPTSRFAQPPAQPLMIENQFVT